MVFLFCHFSLVTSREQVTVAPLVIPLSQREPHVTARSNTTSLTWSPRRSGDGSRPTRGRIQPLEHYLPDHEPYEPGVAGPPDLGLRPRWDGHQPGWQCSQQPHHHA